MQICLEKIFPKNLVEALKKLHEIPAPNRDTFNIYWDKHLGSKDIAKTIVFLVDRKSKGVNNITESYFKEGYRVFILKTAPSEKIDVFELSMTVLRIWPDILDIIAAESQPFIYSYKYRGKKLKAVKIE